MQRIRSPRAVWLAVVWLAVHAAPQERAVAQVAVIGEVARARKASWVPVNFTVVIDSQLHTRICFKC